jgi:soluble lytic murein transglycosylase-like protein
MVTFLPVARAAARRHVIHEGLFLRLVQLSINCNTTAKSHAGTYGLAQLIPSTARYLGVDVRAPYKDFDGPARYLKKQ